MIKGRNYDLCRNVEELYHTFKIDFHEFINKTLVEDDTTHKIKLHYSDYEFNKVRMLIEEQCDKYKRKCLDSIEEGVSDLVYNSAYRNWKAVDNMFMVFDEKYNDLLELNIT
jgi:hypothetical protein